MRRICRGSFSREWFQRITGPLKLYWWRSSCGVRRLIRAVLGCGNTSTFSLTMVGHEKEPFIRTIWSRRHVLGEPHSIRKNIHASFKLYEPHTAMDRNYYPKELRAANKVVMAPGKVSCSFQLHTKRRAFELLLLDQDAVSALNHLCHRAGSTGNRQSDLASSASMVWWTSWEAISRSYFSETISFLPSKIS